MASFEDILALLNPFKIDTFRKEVHLRQDRGRAPTPALFVLDEYTNRE